MYAQEAHSSDFRLWRSALKLPEPDSVPGFRTRLRMSPTNYQSIRQARLFNQWCAFRRFLVLAIPHSFMTH